MPGRATPEQWIMQERMSYLYTDSAYSGPCDWLTVWIVGGTARLPLGKCQFNLENGEPNPRIVTAELAIGCISCLVSYSPVSDWAAPLFAVLAAWSKQWDYFCFNPSCWEIGWIDNQRAWVCWWVQNMNTDYGYRLHTNLAIAFQMANNQDSKCRKVSVS